MQQLVVEGMGVIGSIVAWALDVRDDRDWRWVDADSPVTAWRASTGSVYPSGDHAEQQQYERWRALVSGPAAGGPVGVGIARAIRAGVLRASCNPLWYCTKGPPHGFRGRAAAEVAAPVGAAVLRLHPEPSIHVDVQGFVRGTRERFRDRRVPIGGPTAVRAGNVIHAHGFRAASSFVWGWSALADLDISERLRADGAPPAFYLRRGRFELAYAYPVPGTGLHYIGSSMLHQREPRALEIRPKYETWRRLVDELSGGMVDVLSVDEFREGWRPASRTWTHPGLALSAERWGGGVSVVARPMSHSGVRMGLAVADSLLDLERGRR